MTDTPLLSAASPAVPLPELMACPTCDALYRAQMPEHGERAVCTRCHTVLIAPRRRAGLNLIALSLAATILVIAAMFFPFLEIHTSGLANKASILDVALSFQSGLMVALSAATVAMIVLFPLLRTVLLLYVLVPVVYDRPPARHAKRAFRLAQGMKPWSMSEIFAIGCAVALVKVADLAQIALGPAFWMFALLVVIMIIQDLTLCAWSVWNALDTPQP